MKQDAERLLAGELSYLDYAAACAAEDARCADLVSDAPYWAMLQRARDEGKKIIYVSGPAPVELIYAFDCVPMSFDLLTPRLSENAALIPPLMRACELRANADVCRLSKAQIGTILVGDMGLRPDAYVAVPIPCDSACMAYMALAARVGAPTFQFDVPKRPGGRTLAYLAAQEARRCPLLASASSSSSLWAFGTSTALSRASSNSTTTNPSMPWVGCKLN